MSYKKTVWEDFVTPLDENNMNNIENGIEHVDQELHKTQEDLRQTKKHLDQTDINVATNKQAIIDLETKHDEDVQNLDDKFTNEINDTNTEVATKLPKQDIDILKDVNIEVNGDQAFITKTTVNLNNDTLEPVEQTATQIIPDATEQQSGLMTKATVKAINQMQEQIEQLQGKTTRLLYTASENPTAEEINAFVIAEGYTEPFDGIAVVIDETYHIWHYYEGGTGWKDDGLDTVTTFTNDIAGIIKGSNDDGKVYANADGTGSVKGWDIVKQDIDGNKQAIAQRATLTQLATTNQNVTDLTNHVDDVEEQLQQNIDNADTALDNKITNLNNKTLQLPSTAPTKQSIVTITTGNVQQNLTSDNFVMTTAQTLTADQKTQVRLNLDLPTTLFDGSYTSLGNKPVLNTDNSTTLATNAAEEINGIMNLHKISKTGTSTDLVDSADLARQTELTAVTNALNEKLGNSGEQILNGNLTSLSTEQMPVNYIAVSKEYTLQGPSATQDMNINSKISPSIIDLSREAILTNSSGTTTTVNSVRIDPSSIRISGSAFSFNRKNSADDSYTPVAAILTSNKFHFFDAPTVSVADGTSEDLMRASQVVRTDTPQSLTDAEKQQAQTNITHTATQNHATSGVQVGWYQVANLKTNGNYDIKIKQTYNYNLPEAIHLSISINNRLSTVEPFASITQLSGVNPGAFSLSKIRVRQGTDEGTTYLDVYNPDQLWNSTWVDITSDSQDVVVEPNSPFQFIGTEDNPSGYKVSSLDLSTGLNTDSLRVENTVTISGTVSNLNTISQPVNSAQAYCFSGGCANSPITDSGFVIQYQESTSYCTQLVIANDQDGSTWRRSYRDGTWTAWQKIFTASTPNWVSGTSGSLTLPGAGWYILYGNYSYTGIVWWSPQDPNGEQVTTGYIALNNNIAISTSGVVSLLNASSGVTVYYYKIG